MRIAYTSRYDLESHFGGCIIHDNQTGQDVLIQAGDDATTFGQGLCDLIKNTDELSVGILNNYLAQYFGE